MPHFSPPAIRSVFDVTKRRTQCHLQPQTSVFPRMLFVRRWEPHGGRRCGRKAAPFWHHSHYVMWCRGTCLKSATCYQISPTILSMTSDIKEAVPPVSPFYCSAFYLYTDSCLSPSFLFLHPYCYACSYRAQITRLPSQDIHTTDSRTTPGWVAHWVLPFNDGGP